MNSRQLTPIVVGAIHLAIVLLTALETANSPPDSQERVIWSVLTFPLGNFAAAFSGRDATLFQWSVGLALLAANSFIWGYAMTFLVRALQRSWSKGNSPQEESSATSDDT